MIAYKGFNKGLVCRGYQFSNGQKITKNNYMQTLNLNGNIKLTPRLSLNMSTGFDLMALKMTTTQLSARYDLHCFNIDLAWSGHVSSSSKGDR